jgi:hypothetical protein
MFFYSAKRGIIVKISSSRRRFFDDHRIRHPENGDPAERTLSLLFLITLTFPITIHYGTCADTCPNKVIEYSWSRLLKI